VKQNQKDEFGRILSAVAQMYSKKMTKTTFNLYFESLKNYDFSVIRQALESHLINPDVGQFMPKPADIVREIEGGTEDRALIAWTKFEKAISSVGHYKSIVFDDARIHVVVVDMGGWIKFGTVFEKEMPFLRIEFVKRYRATKNVTAYRCRLVGLIEADCAEMNAPLPAPRLFGDEKKCLQVMYGGKTPAELTNETKISKLLPQMEKIDD